MIELEALLIWFMGLMVGLIAGYFLGTHLTQKEMNKRLEELIKKIRKEDDEVE